MTAAPSPASHTSPGAVTAAVRSVLSVPAWRVADERLYLGAARRLLAQEGSGDESHGEPEVGVPADQCERRRIDAGTAKAVVVAGLEEDVLLKDDVAVREGVVPVAFSAGRHRLVRMPVAQHSLDHRAETADGVVRCQVVALVVADLIVLVVTRIRHDEVVAPRLVADEAEVVPFGDDGRGLDDERRGGEHGTDCVASLVIRDRLKLERSESARTACSNHIRSS